MAINPGLSLQVLNQGDFDKQNNDTRRIQLAADDQAFQQKRQITQDAATERTQKLKEASDKIDRVGQIIGSAVDQDSYSRAKQVLGSQGIDVSPYPDQFDPNVVKQATMMALDAKDKVNLELKKIDNDFERQKFGETQRHNKATEGMFGNSLEGKAYNVLLNGDPSSPEYALATSAATKPRYQQVTGADGSIQLVAVKPDLPSSIRPPAGVLTPPTVGGVQDATPSTPNDQLLAPPAGMGGGYSVTPINGTQQPAKPTEGQSNAGLYAKRMEEADKVIGGLESNGYKPSLATDSLADSAIGNSFLTPQGQQFTQAKRDFVNAVLRRESGAAIAPSEFANANKQYFAQPGDSKEVLAQKQANRQTAMQGIRNAAGPAYKGGSTKLDNLKSKYGLQ